jgi:hypothetical protein
MVMSHFSTRGGLEGFDFDGAFLRVCDAIMSSDAALSAFAADEAASHLGNHFFDDVAHRLSLQSALDWAVGVHGELYVYQWLANELQPEDAQASFEHHSTTNERVKALADTTATLEPEIALIELRHLLPDTPAEALRVPLIARWKEDHAIACLSALCGLVLELTDKCQERDGLIGLCLHSPLLEGPAPLIDRLLTVLSERFERLDSWIGTEGSVRDLQQAARRFNADMPETAAGLSRLLDRVRQRRLVLLEEQILEKLQRAAVGEPKTDPFDLALGLYRLCVPGEARLAAPIRSFMRARSDQVEWRRARLYLESMALTHFGAFDEADGYDRSYLLDVFSDGLRDIEVELAWLAAALATKLVDKGLLTRIDDLDRLRAAMQWADNLFDPVPDSFGALQTAIADALQRAERQAGG